MTLPVFKTERLTLRALAPSDSPAMTAGLSDWSVMQYLSGPPWPFGQKEADWFINDESSNAVFAIEQSGALVGTVGLMDGLGYWLGRAHWGKGVMTEAARAVIGWYFATAKPPLMSGHFTYNIGSRAVLKKLGFVDTRLAVEHSNPLGRDVVLQHMELNQERWQRLSLAAG
ncbi:MAG: GNAT family N-acetyltransferase [Rhodobacteraceae bacterium]|nr:GNAT family N-acetyltransferase [Paracoccaceae bacterium]